MGPHAVGSQQFAGSQLHRMLLRHHLAAVDTFFPAGPSWRGPAGQSSHIDHWVVPMGMVPSVQSCVASARAARKLQL
eukprot:2545079-Alexandrium_andersonii.AAC.1